MFRKYATVKTKIIPYNDSSEGLKAFGSKEPFGSAKSFPDKYGKILRNYEISQNFKPTADKKDVVRISSHNPEFKYYRVIAMHGDIPNDNGDMFRWGSMDDPAMPELMRVRGEDDKHVYETFIGRGNHKNHDNKNVLSAVGIIIDVCPNQDSKFVEALLAVDKAKDPYLISQIESGQLDAVSMGANVEYSLCSICGHKATTENEYCDHIRYNKGSKISVEGELKPVFEDNRKVNFCEISWVNSPADTDALLLEKVAKKNGQGKNKLSEILKLQLTYMEKLGSIIDSHEN